MEWADLYFTGSLTTYQYNETSDADHSVFPNYDKIWKHLNLDPDTCRKMLIDMSISHLDGAFLPGTQHPIQYFVMPYGTLPHDVFAPGLRSAWDLFDDSWFVKPEKNRVHDIRKEFPQVYARAAAIADKMTQMLDSGNIDAAKELWYNVHKKRQLDQRAGLGDFSEGNITLKWLLHEGLIDRLRNEAHMVIQTKVAETAQEYWRWNGDEEKLMQAIRIIRQNRTIDDPSFAKEALTFMTELMGMPEDQAQQFWANFVANEKEWLAERDRRNLEMQQAMEEGRAKYQEEAAARDAQYGNEVRAILGRFDAMKPDDAPPYDMDEDEWIQHMVEQGWTWKFVVSKGYGAYVWGDGEVDAPYDGRLSHTEVMRDLMDLYDDERPGVKKSMAGGWIMRAPLTENVSKPYTVEKLGGEQISDAEILEMLGLSPQEATVEQGTEFRMGRTSALPHLWEDRVTTKVIYDFDQDRIILGTQAALPNLPDSKIVGEYVDGNVILYEADKRWINPTYFRRLWAFSYPHRALKDVYFRRSTGDEYKLRSLPRKRKQDDVRLQS